MLIISLFEKAKLRQNHEITPFLAKKWRLWQGKDGEYSNKRAGNGGRISFQF